jgi:hypothetical protein
MLDHLSAPFPVEAIHWRAQALTRDGTKALALAYLDARDVMDRLDAACGPLGWEDSYVETTKGRVLCTLSIKNPEGAWVSKCDGAGDTAVEGEKGGISDAFKRAAVKWGVGRYLYNLNDVWAPCEINQNNKWKAWKPEAQDVFAKALARVGRPTAGPLNDATRDWLGAQLQSVGKEPGDLLRHLSPTTFKDLSYEQLPAIQQFINVNKKAA